MAYIPKGIEFYDFATGKPMLLVDDDALRWGGWLLYLHPDGQWVTHRKATEDDRARIKAAQLGSGSAAG